MMNADIQIRTRNADVAYRITVDAFMLCSAAGINVGVGRGPLTGFLCVVLSA